MPDEPSSRPPIGIPIPDFASACSAVISLSVALQAAIEMAVFPERIKIDEKSGRLQAITDDLLRKVKSEPIQYTSEAAELAGMEVALLVINQTNRLIREKM